MATLTIKSLPDELYERLRDQARLYRRSINSEAIVCLERALGVAPLDADDLIAEADALQQRLGRSLDAEVIEQARQERDGRGGL